MFLAVLVRIKINLLQLVMACNSIKPCSSGNFNFFFVTERKTFNSAQQSCEHKGGTLANFLGRNDYEQLNKCCNSQNSFWIGLVDKNRCKSTPNKPYQWVKSTNCRRALPLTVQHQPNNQKCQAVAISFTTQSLPETQLLACNDQIFYVCKTPKQKTTTTTTTTATMKRKATQTLPSTISHPHSTKALWSSTEKTNTHPAILSRATKFNAEDHPLTHASTANPAAIAGAILGSLVVILLIFLFLWRYKKGNYRKSQKVFSQRKKNDFTRINENNANQVDKSKPFCNIISNSLAREPDNFSSEDFDNGKYPTLNGEEAAYQTINEKKREENSEPTSECVYAVVKKTKNNNKETDYSPKRNESHEIQHKDEQIDCTNALIESSTDVIEVKNDIEIEEQPSALYATVSKVKKKKT